MCIYLHLNAYIRVQYSYECSYKWSSICSYKFSYECCHTRLHLKFSAKLKIWQVPACKMEPQSCKIMWKTPSPNLVNVFRLSSGASVECVDSVWRMSLWCKYVGCLYYWKLSGRIRDGLMNHRGKSKGLLKPASQDSILGPFGGT